MNRHDITTLTLILIIAILFSIGLFHISITRTKVLNDYDTCIAEHNEGNLPIKEAWQVYADECK